MASLTLIYKNDLTNRLNDKISFYQKMNKFVLNENIFCDEKTNISNITTTLFIKQLPLILNQINIIYVKEPKSWDCSCYYDIKSPMLVVNLNAIEEHYKENSSFFDNFKESIAYATIFGLLGLFFRQNFKFECFGRYAYTTRYSSVLDTFDYYAEMTRKLFDRYKNKFLLFLTSSDQAINTFFTFGKKYVFSLVILFNEGKIDINQASKLLNLSENKAFILLNEYKGMAYIQYLKHQTGELL